MHTVLTGVGNAAEAEENCAAAAWELTVQEKQELDEAISRSTFTAKKGDKFMYSFQPMTFVSISTASWYPAGAVPHKIRCPGNGEPVAQIALATKEQASRRWRPPATPSPAGAH